jgi:hypothetical protein
MNKLKTYIFLLFTLFLLTWTSCEKLEIPEKEHTSQQEKKDGQGNQQEEKEEQEAETPPQEEQEPTEGNEDTNPTPPGSPDEEMDPDLEELIYDVMTRGISEETAYTVYDFKVNIPIVLEKGTEGAIGWKDAYVKGYIVGYVKKGAASMNKTIFGVGDTDTNVVIADSPDETDYNQCIAIDLTTSSNKAKATRQALNLKNHPENLGKKVIIFGNIEPCKGVLGMVNARACTFMDNPLN